MDKPDPALKLHSKMRLWEFPDQYVVEPTDGKSASFLVISRHDGSMNLVGSYFLVITERECVGSHMGRPIFKVASLKVFPCDHSLKNSPEEQKKMESEFSRLLNVAERTPGLYFSYDVNITLSAQRLHELGDESKVLPLWRQADPRFLWNNYMLEVLIDSKLDPYVLPIMQGSFHCFQVAIGKEILDVMLIARRCTRRTGTRMWRRGADSDGFVANFVETEQMIHLNGYTASFVQVRGSMPFLWDQIVDLTYKPKFEIVKPEEASHVAERHFLDLRKKYGNVLAIDLVNKHGGEGRLCEKFGSSMESIAGDDVRYLHFDFHKICGHVHFERLSILYDQIEDFLIKSRYLLLNEKGEKLETQIGVVRTNCIDCLDRTNVTQSMIARRMLEYQLRRLGVFDAEETVASHPNFDDRYKILWANHGDDVSIQYSGTPALKGDFVRYGQRTMQGILTDGWNALVRYYLNNFCDGTKQDAIDLVQGHYILSVSRSAAPTAEKGGIEAIASFPLALGLIMTGFFFAMLSLRRGEVPPGADSSAESSKKVKGSDGQNHGKNSSHQNGDKTRHPEDAAHVMAGSSMQQVKPHGTAASPSNRQAAASSSSLTSSGHSTWKKTQMVSGNHLLNFQYNPIPVSRPQPRAPPPRRQQKRKPYNKDLFFQANYKFVLLDSGNYAADSMDPDKMLCWEDIICLKYSTPFPVQCPICLDDPLCPQITSCGHIFCFSCILQYLSMCEDDHKGEHWKKCPLCFTMISSKDLYTIHIENVKQYHIGDEIQFVLLTRQKDSYSSSIKNSENFNIEGEILDSFSKFTLTSDVALSVREAMSDLDSWIARADSGLVDDIEKLPYVCAAMQQLENRKKYWNKRVSCGDKATASSYGSPPTEQMADANYGGCDSSWGEISQTKDDKSVLSAKPSRKEFSSAQVAELNELLEDDKSAPSPVIIKKDGGSYNFYQAIDGQHIILHPLNMKCLLHHYGSYEKLPNRIAGKILQMEAVTQSETTRRRYRFLSHFSLTTTFQRKAKKTTC